MFEAIALEPIETRGAKRKRAALGGKAMKKASAAQAMKAKEEPSASPKAMKAKWGARVGEGHEGQSGAFGGEGHEGHKKQKRSPPQRKASFSGKP